VVCVAKVLKRNKETEKKKKAQIVEKIQSWVLQIRARSHPWLMQKYVQERSE